MARLSNLSTSPPAWNQIAPNRVVLPQSKENAMKGIVAYLLGVPFIVIVLLYVFNVF